MASELIVPSRLDERLKEIYSAVPSFPEWSAYLAGRNGVLDPLKWLLKTNEGAAGDIIVAQMNRYGTPFAPFSLHTCQSAAIAVYLASLKGEGIQLETILEDCPPVPVQTIGHVIVFAHCDPERCLPTNFPRTLSSPVWTTVDDYLRLRLDFISKARGLWQSIEPCHIESPQPHLFDPKNPRRTLEWLNELPTVSARERANLSNLLALNSSDLTPARLPSDSITALISDKGNGPVVLPVGSIAIDPKAVDKAKARASRWIDLGAIPFFLCNGHLFVAAENPDKHELRSQVNQDYPGVSIIAFHGPGDSTRSVFTQLTSAVSSNTNLRANKNDDLSKAAFFYDPRKFEGRSPRMFADDIPSLFQFIVGEAAMRRASDIHIDQMQGVTRVLYDIDGISRLIHSLPVDFSEKLANHLSENVCKKTAESTTPGAPREGSFYFGLLGKRITSRVAILFCQQNPKNPKIVIRIQDPSSGIKDLSELGLELHEMTILRRAIVKKQGLVVVAGATGQGKSTTLMACIQELNDSKRAIYTLEDPVEYVLPGVSQISVASKEEDVAPDRPSVTDALRIILRMAPKIIMVGEVRDLGTATAAIEASNTGHMIFSTIHANSALDVVRRFQRWKVDTLNFAENVKLITSQRLVRRLCTCAERVPMDQKTQRIFECNKVPHTGWISQASQKGCPRCNYTGHHGRLVIVELLEINEELVELIASQAPTAKLSEALTRANYHSLASSALRRVATEQTSLEEIAEYVEF